MALVAHISLLSLCCSLLAGFAAQAGAMRKKTVP
jgi:hypothetical protein